MDTRTKNASRTNATPPAQPDAEKLLAGLRAWLETTRREVNHVCHELQPGGRLAAVLSAEQARDVASWLGQAADRLGFALDDAADTAPAVPAFLAE